jgi:hypothetical protein
MLAGAEPGDSLEGAREAVNVLFLTVGMLGKKVPARSGLIGKRLKPKISKSAGHEPK